MSDLRQRLATEIDIADWNMLEPHNNRGTLFLVRELDLVDVGVALAEDQTTIVKQWLDAKLIEKPNDKMVTNWKKTPNQKLARFIIIQPYVLMKIEDFN